MDFTEQQNHVGERRPSEPPTEAALRLYGHVARRAMEVGAVVGLNGLKAIRNNINGWNVGVFVLEQAGHARFAAFGA